MSLDAVPPIPGSSVPSCGCPDCPSYRYAYRLELRHHADERQAIPLEQLAHAARDYLRGTASRKRLRELVQEWECSR